jgi:aspartyl/asparaginyl-tRNA synthetase
VFETGKVKKKKSKKKMYELKIHNLKVLANQTEAFGKYHYQVLEVKAWVQSS